MTEPRWIDKRALLLLHDDDLAEHGGLPGLRDEGLLDSALARPLNLFAYGDPTMADLAASTRSALREITRSRMGTSGRRSSASACSWRLNGISFRPDKVEATRVFLALAAGEVSEEELAAWIDRNSRKREG